MTKKQRIQEKIAELQKNIDKRLEDGFTRFCYKNNPHLPTIKVKDIAKVLVEQQDFIDREILIGKLLHFYMVNPLDFKSIVSDGVRKHAQFDERKAEYLWESMNDIAIAVEEGKVYLEPNGLFSAWCYGKKRKAEILTIDNAKQDCDGYIIGGI